MYKATSIQLLVHVEKHERHPLYKGMPHASVIQVLPLERTTSYIAIALKEKDGYNRKDIT